MAQLFAGINRGQLDGQVVFSAATNGTDIEIRIDRSKNLNDVDRTILLETLHRALITYNNWGDNNP
jgi:hypothetical protein